MLCVEAFGSSLTVISIPFPSTSVNPRTILLILISSSLDDVVSSFFDKSDLIVASCFSASPKFQFLYHIFPSI